MQLYATGNKAIVDSRLRPRCAINDEYLSVCIIGQILVGIYAIVAVKITSCC